MPNINKNSCCGMRFAQSGSERKNNDKGGREKRKTIRSKVIEEEGDSSYRNNKKVNRTGRLS
jgi:hypothetical protein